jgi:hypothetical protein
MRFVDNQTKVVFLSYRFEPFNGSHIAIHAENRIGYDPCASPLPTMPTHQGSQRFEILMGINDYSRSAEATAIDQARVVEPIAKQDVLVARQSAHHPHIRRIST